MDTPDTPRDRDACRECPDYEGVFCLTTATVSIERDNLFLPYTMEQQRRRVWEMIFFQGCARWKLTKRILMLEDTRATLVVSYPTGSVISEYTLNGRFFLAHTHRVLVVYLTRGKPISRLGRHHVDLGQLSIPHGIPRRPGRLSGQRPI